MTWRLSIFPLLFLLLTACGSAEYTCTDQLGCLVISPDQPILIGVLATTHAEKAPEGLALLAAVQEFVVKFGALSNHDVVLTWEGTDCTEDGARLAAALLVQVPDLLAVIGPSCPQDIPFSVPIFEDAGILVVEPSLGGQAAFDQLIAAINISGISQDDGTLIIPRSTLQEALTSQP